MTTEVNKTIEQRNGIVEVTLQDLYRRLLKDREAPANLIDAASAVANAIAVGAGGLIHNTLMEKEFRDALKLKPHEIVAIPK